MLKTIALEIRDRATFIPVLAIDLFSGTDQEQWLVRRTGFTPEYKGHILVTRLDPMETIHDVYDVENERTRVAYRYIQDNFARLQSGDVIDIEYILDEKKTKKVSEYYRLEYPSIRVQSDDN